MSPPMDEAWRGGRERPSPLPANERGTFPRNSDWRGLQGGLFCPHFVTGIFSARGCAPNYVGLICNPIAQAFKMGGSFIWPIGGKTTYHLFTNISNRGRWVSLMPMTESKLRVAATSASN